MRRMSLVVCAAVGAISSVASAQLETELIDFNLMGGMTGDRMPSPYVEDGLRITNLNNPSGFPDDSWLQTYDNNEPNSLPGAVYTPFGSSLSLTVDDQTPGNPLNLIAFAFVSLHGGPSGGEPREFIISGRRLGVEVWSEQGIVEQNNWGTYGAGHFDEPVDRIHIFLLTGLPGDEISMAMDAIQFQLVPAPGALALFAGAGLLVARRRR